MLSAQFSAAFQPVVEEAAARRDDFQRLQGQVLVALGLVVRVDFLQRLVEFAGKGCDVGRFLFKFYDPLVAASAVVVHEYGSGCVFAHHGAGQRAGALQSLLGIVHYQLFAEGVDEALGASADDEFIGTDGGEAHGVANLVAPQAARGGDDDGIVSSGLDGPQGEHRGVGLAHLLERDELVEHAIVQHEQHGGVGGVVLQAKEALRGVVGLHVAHPRRADQPVVLLAVGGKGHAAVEEDFEVGPDFVQVALARNFQHAVDDGHHPRGHAAQVGHVLAEGNFGDAVALFLEVGEQGNLLGRCAHQVDQRIDVLDEDGRQVAHERVWQVVVGRMTAAQYQGAAVKEAAVGVVAQVEGHCVSAAGIVGVAQSVGADRYELALVVGRAG